MNQKVDEGPNTQYTNSAKACALKIHMILKMILKSDRGWIAIFDCVITSLIHLHTEVSLSVCNWRNFELK